MLLVDPFSKCGIILGLGHRIEQTNACCGNRVEKHLRQMPEGAGGQCFDVSHPRIGRMRDHVGIRLKAFQAQESIVVRGLVFGRNSQPFVIGIERWFVHGQYLSLSLFQNGA